MHEKLLKIVTNLGSPKILVVGDFVLDSYVYGDAMRISPEAPVQVLKVVDRQHRCGGAGSVAADLVELGAEPICIGIIGRDDNGKVLRGLLADQGIDTSGIFEVDGRPTISKQRMVGLAQHRHRQQLLRIDEECTDDLPGSEHARILKAYKARLKEADIVCLQDYNKGLLSGALCREMVDLAKAAGKKVLVDPPLARADDYMKYSSASLITPNRREASAAAGFAIETIDDARRAAKVLVDKCGVDAAVITLDKEGAFLLSGEVCEHIPTVPRSVYDVTGAGDMVLAMLAVGIAAGCDYSTAVHLSNIAGGLEVEKFGVQTVSIDEIVNEIITSRNSKVGKICCMETLLAELSFHRQQKEIIVFTNGCFDVLHVGHIEFLKFCKKQGDILVMGLNSDSSVRQIKGPERPINNQLDRAAVLAALEMVDYVVIFDEPDPLKTIESVKPDVLVKGVDWAEKGVVGREFVESNGGKVILAPLVEGKSSTATIEKMQSLKDAQQADTAGSK